MKLLRTLIPAALMLAAPLAAQTHPGADLKVGVTWQDVEFEVRAPADPFLGVVLIGLDPVLICCLPDMPPLLAGSVVLGWGGGSEGAFVLNLPRATFPTGVKCYLQGVAVTDAVLSSELVGLRLEVGETG